MLQYQRRNRTKTSVLEHSNEINIPLLTYCNWSYNPIHHIDLDMLKNILHSFNREYIPFYLRIFNETPIQVLETFLEKHHISKSSLQSIYQELEADKFKVKVLL